MRKFKLSILAVLPILLAGATASKAQEQNPVKSSLAVIEEAGRFYRYDCEMCHGADGSGKGDLAQDMKLETHDWRTGTVIEKMTDGEIFTIITKGKGKMVPEGERVKAEIRWGLVHYVRLLARKGGGGSAPPTPAIGKPSAEEAKPAAEAPKPAVEAPKPPADAPKPAAEAPKPAADAPKPTGDAPKPPAEEPKPPADAPAPPADAPKPPVR